MADDLRQRYEAAIRARCPMGLTLRGVLDAVLAVRDEELEQLRYERRLLGAARLVLDLVAAGDSSRWGQARREAEGIAQRIVDEIGHPVTDEPALGPGYRAEIARLQALREDAEQRAEQAEASTAHRAEELAAVRRQFTAAQMARNAAEAEAEVVRTGRDSAEARAERAETANAQAREGLAAALDAWGPGHRYLSERYGAAIEAVTKALAALDGPVLSEEPTHVLIDRSTIECVLLDHVDELDDVKGKVDASLAELAYVYRGLTGFDAKAEWAADAEDAQETP